MAFRGLVFRGTLLYADWGSSMIKNKQNPSLLLRKPFSKFYRRHSGLIVKYNVGLKALLQQGHISELVFYTYVGLEFKRIVGKQNFYT